ncbi:hypothetical protein SY2F82_34850 [Streptomyces sp. Y2F8-2]|nr:hypothetical protein SY2F82_34850 [Streptomyces sp. Y2F8-2]
MVRLCTLPPSVRRSLRGVSGAGELPGLERPTVFATQSTHKLLAALSQGAMVHIRPAPRAPVEHDRFNETLMMHGTTSPLYPMIASLDVATAMMDGPQGRWLVDEAVGFRQEMVRIRRRIEAAGDRPPWFFGVRQPETVTDPASGKRLLFDEAPPDLLRLDSPCIGNRHGGRKAEPSFTSVMWGALRVS